MRQTVEEAAKEYIYKARASFVGITPEEYEEQINPEYPYNVGTDEDFESLFIAGADWQAKQSPWISVEERLPEQNKLVLCRMVSNGAIVSGYIFVEDKKLHVLLHRVLLNLRIGTTTSVTCGCLSPLSMIYSKPTRMYWNGLRRKETEYESKERNNNRWGAA